MFISDQRRNQMLLAYIKLVFDLWGSKYMILTHLLWSRMHNYHFFICINRVLQKNHFSGVIPKELGELTKLELLDLSNNKLSGIIPVEISRLPSLKRLWVICLWIYIYIWCLGLTGSGTNSYFTLGCLAIINLKAASLWNSVGSPYSQNCNLMTTLHLLRPQESEV